MTAAPAARPATGTRFTMVYPSGESSVWVVTSVRRTAATGGSTFVFYAPEFAYTDGGRDKSLGNERLETWMASYGAPAVEEVSVEEDRSALDTLLGRKTAHRTLEELVAEEEAPAYRVSRSTGGDYRVMTGRTLVRNFGRRQAEARSYAEARNAARALVAAISPAAAAGTTHTQDGAVVLASGLVEGSPEANAAEAAESAAYEAAVRPSLPEGAVARHQVVTPAGVALYASRSRATRAYLEAEAAGQPVRWLSMKGNVIQEAHQPV